MTDRPIIFSGPMVRALLAGRKTMTRRLAWMPSHLGGLEFSSEELEDFDARGWHVSHKAGLEYVSKPSLWQKVKAGDRLYVRESILQSLSGMTYPSGEYVSHWSSEKIEYLADDPAPQKRFLRPDTYNSPWMQSRPSIHMPRVFSRLTLIVTATKIQHLRDISERDALREGIYAKQIEIDGKPATGYFGANDEGASFSAKREFECLWCGLHGVESWNADPQVVALTFAVHRQNIDAMQVAA